MHRALARPLIAVAAVAALLGVAACADPDGDDSSATTVAPLTSADTATIPPTSSTAPPQPGDVVNVSDSYTVQQGDFLSGIASRYGITLDLLVSFNQWPEGDQHQIFPGDVIGIPPGHKIPGETTTTTAAPTDSTGAGEEGGGEEGGSGDSTTAPPTTVDTSAGGTYTVQANDYLGGIAKKVGSTVEAIVEANGWSDGANHVLHPGDQIKIP